MDSPAPERSKPQQRRHWGCHPLSSPRACWQPWPTRLGHQAHSAAWFWPERVSVSPNPRAPFLLTLSLGSHLTPGPQVLCTPGLGGPTPDGDVGSRVITW